jgi:hypothetical protein
MISMRWIRQEGQQLTDNIRLHVEPFYMAAFIPACQNLLEVLHVWLLDMLNWP